MNAGRILQLLLLGAAIVFPSTAANCEDPDPDYFHSGELAGSLKSEGPLAVYHPDVQHLWNRLFSVLYIRKSNLPAEPGGQPVKRYEGGDHIDFLAWGQTRHWSAKSTNDRLNRLLDEFLQQDGAAMIDEPLKKAVLLRDLWAAFDQFTEQNLRRTGSVDARRRQQRTCQKLARAIEALTLPAPQIMKLPDTYAAAIRSGHFADQQDFVSSNNYLPHGLLTNSEQWVEVDFHQPGFHTDLYDRFITQHAREYRGRSYFRIFYRHPDGRNALVDYLRRLEQQGVDWKQAAQEGFIRLKMDAPQILPGTEVALVQFLVTLDDKLRPTPTKVVESIRHRTYRTVDGSGEAPTNTGVGMHVMEYTMKRRLLFSNLHHGGLAREPDDLPLYRIIYQPQDAPDWGTQRRKVLFQQCADCHVTPRVTRPGVHSILSIGHMGGFSVGAQMGIVHPLDPKLHAVQGRRVARWKTEHVTYLRLLDLLDR